MHFLHQIGFFILMFIAFLGGMGWFLSPQDELRQADAIVAISGDEGRRFETARRLFKEGFAEKIIFSGAAQDPLSESNASVARRIAIEEGVPSIQIIIEEDSRSTRENAINVARIIDERNIDSIILVTSPYHQRRAYLEFDWATNSRIEIVNYSVKNDDDWRRSQWWITPNGWYLTISEGLKIAFTSIQHSIGANSS